MSHKIGSEIALKIQRLTVAYDSTPALWDVSLVVPAGVVMGIVGPNGAGKSTLLKSVLGIVPKLSGEIHIGQTSASNRKNQVGYIPQKTTIDWDFPITVRELVLMGTYGTLGWFRRVGKMERKRANDAIARVEMDPYADRLIGELSGGQQQRAFLARAFVQDAPLLLMDEPFSGVDATTEKTIVGLMHQMREQGKTLLVVHHDLSTVIDYFDQITLLNREIIGTGEVSRIFNQSLLQKAYGDSSVTKHAIPSEKLDARDTDGEGNQLAD